MSKLSRINRRNFLRLSASSLAFAPAMQAFAERVSLSDTSGLRSPGFGQLRPVKDGTTGLELLQLPEGFSYWSYGWAGDPLEDGTPTPEAHDGMAVTQEKDGVVTLTRNHEVRGAIGSFARPAITFDANAGGGCTNLLFDCKQGKWLKSWASLAGTVRNCAGGATPWNTYLTCEEITLGPDGIHDGVAYDYGKNHGWVFEVLPDGDSNPQPLKAMGRFCHEAVAIDPKTNIVYQTEDQDTSGFYRFLPDAGNQLAEGGRLQMLRARGKQVLHKGLSVGQVFDTDWVDIEEPLRVDSPGTSDGKGVFEQGKAQGGAVFIQLEGACFGHEKVYITASGGGNAGRGQIWEYDPQEETIKLLFESPGWQLLNMPDNPTVSPRGGIVLCEDGDDHGGPEEHVQPQRLIGLTQDGRLFDFAANNLDFRKLPVKNVEAADYREEEWCGATFSFDGNWLFANIQSPGITFAITGPWQKGLI